jgi:hypothetical protein
MKILFVYHHQRAEYWKDGLWWAISEMSKKHDITWLNLALPLHISLGDYTDTILSQEFDFILGWGAFGSPADKFCQGMMGAKGLCLGGNVVPVPVHADNYQIIFYETDWIKENYLKGLNNLVKAFGVNTRIFKPLKLEKIWDYLSVGSFSYWKHLDKMKDKKGDRLCIGEIQKDNMAESMDIISDLVSDGIAVSGMISPEKLNLIYNLSKTVYVPADINGGGERTVLEARSCGCKVEIEDNPKLQELLKCKIPTEKDYFISLNSAICQYG